MSFATMPLDKVPIAVLDLETTGLRPRLDRIIQIGVVDLDAPDNRLDLLVNPAQPVPAASTAVHGIDDAMLQDAESVALVLPRLRDHIGNRIILGYNIGFDLAVLTAEADRCGLEWGWNGALCLRQLAICLLGHESMLMVADLEALARRYEVPTTDRHTALGDAIMTARIFEKMVPELAARNIITLADAWRAVAGLDELRLSTVRAGWVDVAAVHSQLRVSRSLSRIDPYPYQHRIAEMMKPDPVILPPETLLRDAAAIMKSGRQDCVFVGAGPDQVDGIVSERDIVTWMAAPLTEVARARSVAIGQVMSSPVITVQGTDYLHVGLGRMSRLDIRHLGVRDDHGLLVGWVSARELVRQRVTNALVIGDGIADAADGAALKDALMALPSLASSLSDEMVPGQDVAAVISGQYRAALARAAALAEDRMRQDGAGGAPVDYALLVLGSAGRDESMLAADQDHAIVYADPDASMADSSSGIQTWFETLGGHIADFLDQGGIPYCTGGVMSSRPNWCRSLSGWRQAIRGWVGKAAPADLLNVDIFFDFVPVYGQAALANQLQQAISGRATRRSDFLKLLARNASSHSTGRTFFGGFRTKNGRFNVKLNILLPLVETVRVMAISRGIAERGSAARIAALVEGGDVPAEVGELAEDIHMAIRLVLRQQIADIEAGLPPTSLVDLRALSTTEKNILKAVTDRVGRLDSLLQAGLF